MDGQPAWIVPVGEEDWGPHWAVMRHTRFSADSKTVRGRMYFLYLDSYGARWIAYAYPPYHIDREAWEPCKECQPRCAICANYGGWDRYGKPKVCDDCKDHLNFVADDKKQPPQLVSIPYRLRGLFYKSP